VPATPYRGGSGTRGWHSGRQDEGELPGGHALFQLLEPVEDDLDLRSGGCSGLSLAGGDNTNESFAVGSDVVLSRGGRAKHCEWSRDRHKIPERETRLRGHAHDAELAKRGKVKEFLSVWRPEGMNARTVLRHLIVVRQNVIQADHDLSGCGSIANFDVQGIDDRH